MTKKKKKTILIIAGVVVVVIIVIVNMTANTHKSTKVTMAKVKPYDLVEVVSASGRIQPKTKVDITAEVNGEIISLPVREGQRVKAGDLLVVLDTVQARSDVDQARFALDEANARLVGAKTTLEQAEEEYKRQQSLFQQKLSSETEFKNAKYKYLSAKSTHEASVAQEAQAKSRYEKQLDYLSKAIIVAPMTGVITFMDCEVGEIAAAQTAFTQGKKLMTISDLNVFEVEVEVDETEINKVELGQAAEIEVDAFPDTTFKGEVVEIGNTAIMTGMGTEDQSTNFNVKVVFQDTEVKIRPGMSATVDITTANREGVLAVPFSAVVMRAIDLDSLEAALASDSETSDTDESSNSTLQAAETTTVVGESIDEDEGDEEVEREDLKGVFIIREGQARFIRIETGIADQKNIEVTSGLEDGDTVISGPYSVLRTIKDGDFVEVEKRTGEGKS